MNAIPSMPGTAVGSSQAQSLANPVMFKTWTQTTFPLWLACYKSGNPDQVQPPFGSSQTSEFGPHDHGTLLPPGDSKLNVQQYSVRHS